MDKCTNSRLKIRKIMEENLSKLKCGQCGESKHEIYQRKNGELICECIECKSASEITIFPAMFQINNLSGDDKEPSIHANNGLDHWHWKQNKKLN